jgi:hypothetical protein
VLAAAFGLPLLVYRLYALQTAVYSLQREGVRLRWGLRVEEIPISSILWVYPVEELNSSPPLPHLHWPGSVVGVRHTPGGGTVEYLAARSQGLVCLATAERVFAISPANRESFIYQFHRFMEMGSLAPLPARSVHPALLLRRVWTTPPARWLLILGFVFSLALLVLASAAIPNRGDIHLGYHADGSAGDLVPVVQLMLLPVLNSILFVADIFAGLFFFRQEASQPMAYVIWGMGAALPVLVIVGVVFILLG